MQIPTLYVDCRPMSGFDALERNVRNHPLLKDAAEHVNAALRELTNDPYIDYNYYSNYGDTGTRRVNAYLKRHLSEEHCHGEWFISRRSSDYAAEDVVSAFEQMGFRIIG